MEDKTQTESTVSESTAAPPEQPTQTEAGVAADTPTGGIEAVTAEAEATPAPVVLDPAPAIDAAPEPVVEPVVDAVPEPIAETVVAESEPAVAESIPAAPESEPAVAEPLTPPAEPELPVAETIAAPEPVVEIDLVEPAPEVVVDSTPPAAEPIADAVPDPAPIVETVTEPAATPGGSVVAVDGVPVPVAVEYINPCDVEAAKIAKLVDLAKAEMTEEKVLSVLEDTVPAVISMKCLRAKAAEPEQFTAFVSGIQIANKHGLRNLLSRVIRRNVIGTIVNGAAVNNAVTRVQAQLLADAMVTHALSAQVEDVAACYAAVEPGLYVEE